MRQTFSCLSKLGGTTNLIRFLFGQVSISVSISEGLVDFRKFDNFTRLFRNNSAKNCCSELSKDGEDASQ